MALAPLGRYLVAGDVTVHQGVRIPKLDRRIHELSPRETPLHVVGPESKSLIAWLQASGREAYQVDLPWAEGSPTRPAWRLWEPNPWLMSHIALIPCGRALDLGCGTGRDAVALATEGWKVTAVDHLPEAIERARDLEARYGENPISWTVGDAWGTSLSGPFHLITSLRFYDPRLLDLADRLIAPGGWLLIEGFSADYREATGHPSNKDFVIDEPFLRQQDSLKLVDWIPGPKFHRAALQRLS